MKLKIKSTQNEHLLHLYEVSDEAIMVSILTPGIHSK